MHAWLHGRARAGESAARTVRAALNQFETRCGTRAPAQIMVFRFVESKEKVAHIVQEAAKVRAGGPGGGGGEGTAATACLSGAQHVGE